MEIEEEERKPILVDGVAIPPSMRFEKGHPLTLFSQRMPAVDWFERNEAHARELGIWVEEPPVSGTSEFVCLPDQCVSVLTKLQRIASLSCYSRASSHAWKCLGLVGRCSSASTNQESGEEPWRASHESLNNRPPSIPFVSLVKCMRGCF